MTSEKKPEDTERDIVKADVPRATHSGELDLAGVKVPCQVLDGGTCQVPKRGVVALLTGGRERGDLGVYVDGIPNKPAGFTLAETIYRMKHGGLAHGLDAGQLMILLQLYANALIQGKLRPNQQHIGQRCATILFALAGEGLVKRIYEATGYTTDRVAQELARKRVLFLLAKPSEYEEHFPESFWRALFRLYRRPFHASKRPPFFKAFIRRFIHDAVDKDMAAIIKQKNPNPQKGSAHTQYWRVIDLVDAQIARVTILMNASGSPADFRNKFDNEMKGLGLQLSFEDFEARKPPRKKSGSVDKS